MTIPPEKRLNFYTGVAALVLLGTVVAIVVVGSLGEAEVAPAPRFVAYFDDSEDLRIDDRVRLLGRNAGFVTAVDLASVEGRAKVRVEFELRLGWLPFVEGLSPDTQARIEPGGMRSRPRLVLDMGQGDGLLAPGAEVKARKREGGPRLDPLEAFGANLKQADEIISQAVKVLDGPAVREALDAVKRAGDVLAEAGPMLDGISTRAPEVNLALDNARTGCDKARDNVAAARESLEAALKEAGSGTQSSGAQVESLHEKVAAVGRSMEELSTAVESAARGVDSSGSSNVGRQLRVMAARLRASQDMSAGNPALFGDMPTSRFWRPYLHGDTFRPGTRIPEEK